jgi:1-acyl-sn-glycerol-3-phosphate acyltransferase
MTVFLRSLLFNICYTGWAMGSAILFAPLFLASSHTSLRVGHPWATVTLWLARVICGITYEVRGREYMSSQPVIYASKHQSAWDTMIFLTLFPAPAYILKRELLRIPLWGWYLWRMKMIAIDRSAGASGLKDMVKQAKATIAAGRPIIIFPEGTRRSVGAEAVYHPGIIALYNQLKLPVIPVALNSGVFWGKNAFTKRPGKIIMEFLPPVAPGLPKEEFMAQLQSSIETASAALTAEARAHTY